MTKNIKHLASDTRRNKEVTGNSHKTILLTGYTRTFLTSAQISRNLSKLDPSLIVQQTSPYLAPNLNQKEASMNVWVSQLPDTSEIITFYSELSQLVRIMMRGILLHKCTWVVQTQTAVTFYYKTRIWNLQTIFFTKNLAFDVVFWVCRFYDGFWRCQTSSSILSGPSLIKENYDRFPTFYNYNRKNNKK